MEKQKKIMLLGGIRYLLPVIEAAHKQGYFVITADYLPDNIAHKYSDKYINVSIVDKEAVLKAALEEQIDGIMSFGVDPGVISAAYVQQQMNLPAFGPYESVVILQNKDKFRTFLKEHGFNVPWAFGFSSIQEAMNSESSFSYPLIVKPTDSAGSKGVTRVDCVEHLADALVWAMDNSISGHIIVEEFIEKKGCSSDTDCFSVDGKLRFVSFSAQRFDENAAGPYVPAAYSWPSTMNMQEEEELASELQRLLSLLNMQTSIYNVETRVGANGKPYIMEVSPRGGGNRLAEVLRYGTGVDLITACVRAAVGDWVGEMGQCLYNGHWAEVILHADRDGHFERLETAPEIQSNIVEMDLWVKKGDKVAAFKGANDAIGTLILKFDTDNQMENFLMHQFCYLNIIINN
ncbi:MAG: ATP-grasp domain-containing protein [Odoribacter sp.]|nr:ATP-grasp domain-containing protein [Odoribacter sp.]